MPDYENDICYECQGYGDDYYVGDDGELTCACDNCPLNFPPEDTEEETMADADNG